MQQEELKRTNHKRKLYCGMQAATVTKVVCQIGSQGWQGRTQPPPPFLCDCPKRSIPPEKGTSWSFLRLHAHSSKGNQLFAQSIISVMLCKYAPWSMNQLFQNCLSSSKMDFVQRYSWVNRCLNTTHWNTTKLLNIWLFVDASYRRSPIFLFWEWFNCLSWFSIESVALKEHIVTLTSKNDTLKTSSQVLIQMVQFSTGQTLGRAISWERNSFRHQCCITLLGKSKTRQSLTHLT